MPTTLGWVIGSVGLVVAAFTGLSGDTALILSIAIGSCLIAGLLFSVGREGRRGAIYVLLFPLVFAVLGAMADMADVLSGVFIGDALKLFLLADVPIVLFIAACTEVGYLAGRGLVRLRANRGASA